MHNEKLKLLRQQLQQTKIALEVEQAPECREALILKRADLLIRYLKTRQLESRPLRP